MFSNTNVIIIINLKIISYTISSHNDNIRLQLNIWLKYKAQFWFIVVKNSHWSWIDPVNLMAKQNCLKILAPCFWVYCREI